MCAPNAVYTGTRYLWCLLDKLLTEKKCGNYELNITQRIRC